MNLANEERLEQAALVELADVDPAIIDSFNQPKALELEQRLPNDALGDPESLGQLLLAEL